ncbi:MAG: 4-(cytidine 5'-diphospho)-2-C-methyl-D-erythritol kinase [Streptomycetales bacterium]
MTARAPAKINLHLAVGAPRPDGFHDVATVYHAVSLYDDVVAAPSGGPKLTAEGPGARDVPTDDGNLALRAARLLAARAGVAPDVHLHLRKGIPVAGGMAGGSADAAAALVACDALWGTALPRPELHALAAQLGSDVPFSLVGGTAVGAGRGERLTTALVRGEFHWVLAIADGGLSTPHVYRECDRLRGTARIPHPQVSEAVMSGLRSGDAEALGRALANDLQPAALSLRSALGRVLRSGEEHGALGAIVSGSGPTCAFLAPDAVAAKGLAGTLSELGACRAVLPAQGPVPGARVLEDGE